MKVLVKMEITEDQIEQIGSVSEDLKIAYALDDDEIRKQIADSEVVFGLSVDPEELKAAKELKWIQSFSAGLDKYLYPELVESDVVITNGSGVYGPQISEHAFSFILALSRRLNLFIRNQMKREWKSFPLLQLEGLTLGILGFGGAGRQVARRASAFDMRILAVDLMKRDKPDYVEELWGLDRLEDLIRRSDFLVLTVPLTDRTRHIIDRRVFQIMKPTAYLINVSRGGLVDEEALIEALEDRKISGAGLDVFEKEPLSAESELWGFENVIISTHIAGSFAGPLDQQKIVDFFCRNLRRYLNREGLLNIVDKRAGFPKEPQTQP